MTTAVRVEDLRKRYAIGRGAPRGGYRTLREGLVELARRPFRRAARGEDFWALRGVDFEVAPGEVVGLIGRNGAGKSTLLKVLSRITRPTSGRVELIGRVGSLLEVGTGFHPELTGRENVYLNGSILGMRRAEIARKFDEIVAFSEVERFLDTPVKRYSSGMYVRLAFAVAAHLETEVLLVDEVLSVGDAAFRRRCTDAIRSAGRSGRTILMVSHDLPAVEHLCGRCLLMRGGTIAADGAPADVIRAYHAALQDLRGPSIDLRGHEGRTPESTPAMTRVAVGPGGGEAGPIPMGGDVAVAVGFDAGHRLEGGVCLGVVVKNARLAPILGVNNLVIPAPSLDRPARRGTVTCRLERPPLMPGDYSVDLHLGTRGRDFDVVLDACRFEVLPADHFGSGRLPPRQAGDVYCGASWEIDHDG